VLNKSALRLKGMLICRHLACNQQAKEKSWFFFRLQSGHLRFRFGNPSMGCTESPSESALPKED
jgi:hypothetical protein